jgi:hypothetical protein
MSGRWWPSVDYKWSLLVLCRTIRGRCWSRGPTTTTYSLRVGHHRPLIALQTTTNNQSLSYSGPTMTTHSLTEDDQQPLIAGRWWPSVDYKWSLLVLCRTIRGRCWSRVRLWGCSWWPSSTTTHSLTEGHQQPRIALQRAINDHLLSYRRPSKSTHILTEGHQRPHIDLQRSINNHS